MKQVKVKAKTICKMLINFQLTLLLFTMISSNSSDINDLLKKQHIKRKTSSIQKLYLSNYHDIMHVERIKSKPYFLFLYSNMCLTCKEEFNVLETIANEYTNQIDFYRLSSIDLINMFYKNFTKSPSLLFSKDDHFFLYSNKMTVDVLKRYINAHLGNIDYFDLDNHSGNNDILSKISKIVSMENYLLFIGNKNKHKDKIGKIMESAFEFEFNNFGITDNAIVRSYFEVYDKDSFLLVSFSTKNIKTENSILDSDKHNNEINDFKHTHYEKIHLSDEEIHNTHILDKILINHSLGNFPEISNNELLNLISQKIQFIHFLYPKSFNDYRQVEEIMKFSADNFRKKILFSRSQLSDSQHNEYFSSYFQLKTSDLPALLIFEYPDTQETNNNIKQITKKIDLYKYIRRNVNKAAIVSEMKSFLQDYYEGRLTHELASETIPQDKKQNSRIVKKIVSKTLKNWLVDNSIYDRILMVCTRIHQRCHNMKDRFKKVANTINKSHDKNKNKIKFGYIDVVFNEFELFNYKGMLPNFLFFKQGVGKTLTSHGLFNDGNVEVNDNNIRESMYTDEEGQFHHLLEESSYIKQEDILFFYEISQKEIEESLEKHSSQDARTEKISINSEKNIFTSYNLAVWIQENNSFNFSFTNKDLKALDIKEYPPIVSKYETIEDSDYMKTSLEIKLEMEFNKEDFKGMDNNYETMRRKEKKDKKENDINHESYDDDKRIVNKEDFKLGQSESTGIQFDSEEEIPEEAVYDILTDVHFNLEDDLSLNPELLLREDL